LRSVAAAVPYISTLPTIGINAGKPQSDKHNSTGANPRAAVRRVSRSHFRSIALALAGEAPAFQPQPALRIAHE